MRELAFVVARGGSAGCEEKGRESFEKGFVWYSCATPEANHLALVLLTVIFFFFFPTKQLATNSRAEKVLVLHKNPILVRRDHVLVFIYCTLNDKSCSFLPYGGTSHKFELHL